MKKNLFILFILVSMLFPGCENELPYMNKPQVPQLLMNAFLEAGKKENGVSLRMIDTEKHLFVPVTVSALKRQPKTGNTRLAARWRSLFRSRKLSV